MIIDFHTHTFPDAIAEKTIKILAAKASVPYYSDATAGGLRESMKKAGITHSVVLPVATAARQIPSINRAAIETNGKDGLISFGGIHPDCENPEQVLDGLKEAGIKGIKLHPDYQETYFDDERYIKIMYEAAKRDMLIVTHAGYDAGYPDDTRCTPDRVLNVLERLKGVIEYKLILAHMGGLDHQDEVLESICGKPVFLDTSFVLNRYTEDCLKIISKHGADGILFATDSPWKDQSEFVKLISRIGLQDKDVEKICCDNARQLLGL